MHHEYRSLSGCFILPVPWFVALLGAVIVFALAASNEWLTKKKLSDANALWLKAGNHSLVAKKLEIIKALGMISGVKVGLMIETQRLDIYG